MAFQYYQVNVSVDAILQELQRNEYPILLKRLAKQDVFSLWNVRVMARLNQSLV